jgi:hypothetical protein
MFISNETLLYIFTLFSFYYAFLRKNPDRMSAGIKSIFFTLLVIFILNQVRFSEYFRFEVSPWKKTCLSNHPGRCPGCCLPGFNGQPINFSYASDAERMNQCSEPSIDSVKMNNPNDFQNLGNTYQTNIEPYCGYSSFEEGLGCKKHHYRKELAPVVEGYGCGGCVGPSM